MKLDRRKCRGSEPRREFVLDVGGEGRYPEAWNLNPTPTKTIGNQRGEPIPRHLYGRAADIPLADHSVDRLIVERTPILNAAIVEFSRVVAPGGTILLRHALAPPGDPHEFAKRFLPGQITCRLVGLDGQTVQETEFLLDPTG